MPSSVDDQVLDFYATLFDLIFSEPFRGRISELRRLKPVIRQVEAAADAASSSLTRFFLNQKLSEATVEEILRGFAAIGELLELENIANPNVTTEEIVENVLSRLPCPQTVQQTHGPVYRLALYTVVQVLMLVGPVMAEWQKLNFSSTFELPGRVVNKLNEISNQIDAQGKSGQAGADESYELQYRDYLLQRFHRVEAGTVRMTTNLDVDLRELFVMPRVVVQELSQDEDGAEADASASLMNLAAARRLYGERNNHDEMLQQRTKGEEPEEKLPPTALEQVKCSDRNVIVGLPGAGKSTFFEWLQVKLASVEEKFILGDQQAIPLLLRVRQLDLQNLPRGAALIEKATASKDRADLMPDGWIERQMQAGRVLFMLDGLDETEPELWDKYLIPWLFDLLKRYPKCHYLISSRPVGYPPGLLHQQKFIECNLLDFNESQIQEYTRHWCTAIRLARNESEAEARREGEGDGNRIVENFQDHPYIRNLARNPLMLSAICLVNYFEGGSLPEDRALLYRLCVEGLLHNWDQRRGIHSEFGFDEKLRTCREVALAMQAEDRAEYDAVQVQEIFATVLGDSERAVRLLEHIRYRTGLLLERRPGIFGFAHLTFQEYLAARAVHEGNRLGVDKEQLVQEHDDGRWKEVIALYSGLATTPAVRDLIEQLITQADTESLSEVLTEAYLSGGSELAQDKDLRRRVLERVASAPGSFETALLNRFPLEEVAPIANSLAGCIRSNIRLSESHKFLSLNSTIVNINFLLEKLQTWQNKNPFQLSEIIHLLHKYAPDEILAEMAKITDLYISVGPAFRNSQVYYSQAEIAFIGLLYRDFAKRQVAEGFAAVFRIVISVLCNSENLSWSTLHAFESLRGRGLTELSTLQNPETNQEFALLARKLATHLKSVKMEKEPIPIRERAIKALNNWANLLEGVKPQEKTSRKSASVKTQTNKPKPRKR
ncbi:MAG: NACHT domain-containing protein [Nostoc sp. DedQUE12b]|uniref:NACHT domain-containing protein n=1 Tax=Nostoc sp. DedQUE12b TaxID=3075398 RepID=UPI002AD57F05|nr:NACHT domain-containing protein [Nostoc sp. DedQUE12b]MDZ8089178.1 NACHT domain-containing protein [Nostoc sp. DedQUE12b]